MIIDIVRVFIPAVLAFIIGIIITPPLTDFLYKHKMWKKKPGKVDMSGKDTPIFNQLHKDTQVNTPRMGGVVVWGSVVITVIIVGLLSKSINGAIFGNLNFLSRSQTWIPLFTLIVGALVGLVDDYLVTRPIEGDYEANGIPLKKRLFVVAVIALICSLWFYFKLDVHSISMPMFLPQFDLGYLFLPFFIFIMVAIYAGGVIDGIDGLSGGVFATMFAAYAGIAFYQQQYDLAAFCATLLGGILAFLWFNIPPARYYMSDTGMMGLTLTLGIVAFMTDKLGGGYGVMVLPIIGMPLVITVASNLIQVLSKKFRNGKKVFLVAPLHHHFEALGWPSYKVVMRYWVFSIICSLLGLILALSI